MVGERFACLWVVKLDKEWKLTFSYYSNHELVSTRTPCTLKQGYMVPYGGYLGCNAIEGTWRVWEVLGCNVDRV